MRGLIGIIAAVVALTVVLGAAVVAFGFGTTVVTTSEAEGPVVLHGSVEPADDVLGTRVSVTIGRADVRSIVIERATGTGEDDEDWQEIATISAGASEFVSPGVLEFLDEDVVHGQTYVYRALLTFTGTGSGVVFLGAATASDPARR